MLADALRSVRTLLDRGPDSVRVPVVDLMSGLGTPALDLRAFGVQADAEDTVSLREAGAIAARFESERITELRLWTDYLAACREWEDGRTAAAESAGTAGRRRATAEQLQPGQIRAAARDAAAEAGRDYELTVPRPTYNGEAAHGVARLRYVDESEAARPAGGAS